MKRKIRKWIRKWVQEIVSWFEPPGKKGQWFEEKYYTYLFTRHKSYSSPEPNPEEEDRWNHIRELVEAALQDSDSLSFPIIIDFGCGRGWLAMKLTQYGDARGIEPIGKVVHHGRRIFPGLKLEQGGIEKIEGAGANLIVCSEVIEHIGRGHQQEYFTEFFKALVPGGYLIITTPRAEAYQEWVSYIDLEQPREDWLSESEVRDAANTAGFAVVRKLVYGRAPMPAAAMVQVYQQWLFRRPVL